MTAVLEMRGIGKAFNAVAALDAVDFDCRAGEVHVICGENGAGKSTLMKVLGGSYRPDAGEVLLDGKSVRFLHPREARAAGISIVHQELSLLPFRTVAENIFTGMEPTRWGLLDRPRMQDRARALLQRLGSAIRPDALVADLSIAEQQLVEIAKAMLVDAKVLVMDEPTAALDDRDARSLLDLVLRMKAEGVAIIYISHRMPEVMAIADRVTVLKDGRRVWTRDRADVTVNAIVTAMVGRELQDFYPARSPTAPGSPVLEVRGGGNAQLRDIDFVARAGEIVGVAGLEDSRKSVLAQALFGDAPFTAGQVRIDGQPARLRSPREAAAVGIGYLPGDRKREGIAPRQSVRDNALLTLQAMAPVLSSPQGGARSRPEVDQSLNDMDVRAGDFGQEIATLSGGNQQKAIIARWLMQEPRVFVFVEPTRGIDVAAKAAIYETMRALANSGRAIVMVSSDLPEIIGVSDRILVMHQGRIAGELPAGAEEGAVMRLALGVAAATVAGEMAS
ncbi:sugar ABC transporter ATP-binding protein [Kaistia adipata]|uniref:sugar ABC transporter ATP-binding protein n=1 Tax=Kaistia adipata TaxID=166954 RepID=UPI0003F9151B|nr:sugar ABC transporter ATP-binding protein [Kaistia adipata]